MSRYNPSKNSLLNFPISIAPMMNYTDRHYRKMMRFITSRTILYTEMISTGAILHGKRKKLLEFSTEEIPLILQIGGDNPTDIAECTRIAADYGYNEININVGCPSERVQKGSFGASLMAKPSLVAKIVDAVLATQTIPVGVKCRIGIDGKKLGLPVITDYEHLLKFSQMILNAGASRLSVHARIAILGGLSPKENREIPPLQYDTVYTLIQELSHSYSNVCLEINGGIHSLDEANAHLKHTDSVMLGRIAIEQPFLLKDIEYLQTHNTLKASQESTSDRIELCMQYAEYLQKIQPHSYTKHALRHLFPIFNGIPGARRWRKAITDMMQAQEQPLSSVQYALKYSDISS